jgi:hypothetical protein
MFSKELKNNLLVTKGFNFKKSIINILLFLLKMFEYQTLHNNYNLAKTNLLLWILSKRLVGIWFRHLKVKYWQNLELLSLKLN